ncbi:4-hydroxyphenylpyruvate dioxygenase-like [Brevipalpus obovatus]|uniref:4-hydroxyphenylpyruvate dioxygenase-like n=1 Tax=Brevipalpus obovatus TaxID=246614 RepID=UPI003D9FA828
MVFQVSEESAEKLGLQKVDFVTFWVSNAKCCASYFAHLYRFQPVAYKGLETGSREVSSWVLALNGIRIVFTSPYEYGSGDVWSSVSTRGDMVRDVAFVVDDLDACMKKMRSANVTIVKDIWQEGDQDGIVRFGRINITGTLTHTIDRSRYGGIFLPNFRAPLEEWKLAATGPEIPLLVIDHFVVVCNEDETIKITKDYLD